MKLKNRIIFSVILTFSSIILLFSLLILLYYKKNFIKMRTKTGEAILNSYLNDIEYSGIINNKQMLKVIDKSLKKLNFIDYLVVKRNNKIIFCSKKPNQKSIIVIRKKINTQTLKNKIKIYIELGLNIKDFNTNLKKLLIILILTVILIISLFSLIISYLISKFFRPLNNLELKMNFIAKGNYEKISEKSPYKELIPILTAFNNMIQELIKKDNKIKEQINEISIKNKILQEQLEEITSLKETIFTKEKLAALGTIITSVAHEINNPLAAISGLCELHLISTNDKNLQNLLTKIIFYCDRIKNIVKKLNEYGKENPNITKKFVKLSEVIEEAIEIQIHKRVVDNIKFTGNFKSYNKKFFCSKDEIIQLFTNLINNSIDAMNGKGKIEIEIKEKKDKVEIHFIDNGPGIPKNIKNRIFEPFFTTKKSKGIGLGLYLCYNIVQSHNGKILLKDSKKGAHFVIIFNKGDFKNEKNSNN